MDEIINAGIKGMAVGLFFALLVLAWNIFVWIWKYIDKELDKKNEK